ncbi:M48 family metalloprotease [Allorhizocola rhizosphaerae]|uniref:M48 family metalloprotease n=1 Tax=Allorhizocola rhizosphaerae TaxID=1872709 RepID=UPI000E3E700A|nr:M48 family metalloprotease [Allorhizocola rhizosphaerae]
MGDALDGRRARPDVLAYPVATTGRFVLLVAAMLNAGLLSGYVAYLLIDGDRWRRAAQACVARAEAAALTACMGPTQRVQVAYMLAGAVLIAVMGLVFLMAIPSVLRRRSGLRPAGPRLDGAMIRIAELSAQAGLRRPPRLFVGGVGQRDAFVFGLPGRYCLVLPTALAVRWRDESLFDPVIRHELAHLRRRDVPLAWLATAVWIAALPVLALPLVLSAVRWDFSLMPQYLWRVAVVMAIILLLRRQALRSREHDADLEAAKRAGDHRPLAAVLRTATGVAGRSGRRRLLSHHPTVAQRIHVLERPGRVQAVSIVDGVAAGFLAGLLLPQLFMTAHTALADGPASAAAPHIAGLIVGPILGGAVGLGLWRQALIDRVTGEATWPGGAVVGVAAGLLLGHWTGFSTGGLAGEGLGGDEFGAGFTVPVLLVVGAGAVLSSAGTGRLWADAAARLPGGPLSWWWALAANALIFALAASAMVWMPGTFYAMRLVATTPIVAIDLGDLAIVSGRLIGQVVILALVPFAVAVTAMVWGRGPRPIPPWLLDGPQPAEQTMPARPGPRLGSVLIGGVLAGVLTTIGVAVHRAVTPAPVDDEQRLRLHLLWIVIGAAMALAVSLVALVSVRRAGAAIGLIIGVSTALTAVAGMTAVNVLGFGDLLYPSLRFDTIMSTLSLWTLGYLWLLPLTLAFSEERRPA